jgi:hypothetical protein
MGPIAAALVFLSYSHGDAAIARSLRTDLERAGCTVWTDHRLLAGQNWSREIERALDRADVVVALLSPASYSSWFVRAEQLRAHRKGKLVVPVVAVAGTDVPLALEPLQWVRLQDAVGAVRCK